MTIDDVIQYIAQKTTDASGHIANFTFRTNDVVAHVAARLDTSAGKSPALWRYVWNIHWLSERGQEQRDSSDNLHALLARFGAVDIQATPAASLNELLR